MTTRYVTEKLAEDDDDGTMPENVEELAKHVVGHRIVSAEKIEIANHWGGYDGAFAIELDNGKRVQLADRDDCCAYTALGAFLLHPEQVDHIITGIGTTDGYTTWHIYADFGDVLKLTVDWSAGNPFYYGYGFDITVIEPEGSNP